MNLPAGALAPPGIYVVSHRDPAHAVPHEIIIDLPMILPCCRLCRNVRFSQKSSIPQHIEGHDLFCGKLLPRQSNSRSEIQAFIEASRRQLSASREALHRSVEVLHEHKVTIINSRLPKPERNGDERGIEYLAE